MLKQLVLLCLLAVAVAAGALVSGLVAVQASVAGDPACDHGHASTRTFTIIADIHGFNDSANIPGNWPILTVHKCETVTIKVVNRDVQTHGLAVATYAPNGVAVQPGATQTLTFLANRKGEFRIYCNVLCTVHIFMQRGLLEVK